MARDPGSLRRATRPPLRQAGGQVVPSAARPPVDPRITARRVAVAREQGRRRLRVLVTGTAVVGVVAGAAGVLHSPLVSARHVVVRGEHHTSRTAIVAAAGLVHHPPLVDVPSTAAAAVERLPWVARAVVSVHWPDAVTITVVERVPVAAVARSGGVSVVDRTGRVLEDVAAPPPGLPLLVAGVTPGRPGTFLGPAARPGLVVAAALPPALRGRVQRVQVDPRGAVTLDLGGGVVAELGVGGDLPAKFEALASVLAAGLPAGPAVVDVTVPDEPTVGPRPGGAGAGGSGAGGPA